MADEQSWALPVLAGVVVLGLAAAHGIDRSQWSPRFRQEGTATAGVVPTGRPATPAPVAATTSRVAEQPPTRSAAPTRIAAVVLDQPLGVQAGAPAGAVAARVSTVILQTSVDTCWAMVVDGSAMTGCGPAAVTDTRGAPATAVTRTGGATPVRVEIVRGGRSVADAVVTTTGRALVLSVR